MTSQKDQKLKVRSVERLTNLQSYDKRGEVQNCGKLIGIFQQHLATSAGCNSVFQEHMAGALTPGVSARLTYVFHVCRG